MSAAVVLAWPEPTAPARPPLTLVPDLPPETPRETRVREAHEHDVALRRRRHFEVRAYYAWLHSDAPDAITQRITEAHRVADAARSAQAYEAERAAKISAAIVRRRANGATW